MKYVNTQVGFREVPNRISLLINISGCKCHCPACHSKYLWEDVGTTLNSTELYRLLKENPGVNCVCFMGGDDYEKLNEMSFDVFLKYGHDIQVAWYTGKTLEEVPFYGKDQTTNAIDISLFDYIKVGPYIEEKGPLNSKSTNQRMYRVKHMDQNGNTLDRPGEGELEDITYMFWSNEVLTVPVE